MLSLDMIAYNPAGANHDKVRFYDYNGAGSIKSALAAAFASYSGGLATLNSGTIGASDHRPFEQAGVDAALVIEYNVWTNPYYHQATDAVETSGNIDYVYATKVTRGVLGYLATAAGLDLALRPVDGHGQRPGLDPGLRRQRLRNRRHPRPGHGLCRACTPRTHSA